jgi:hypothetical protein
MLEGDMMGRWQQPFDPQADQPGERKALAVHAALLPIGKDGSILLFSGNRWDSDFHRTGAVDHTALWDYGQNSVRYPGSPRGQGGLPPDDYYDLFCSGHCLLSNGELLVAGGTSLMSVPAGSPHGGHWGGLRESWIFTPTLIPQWVDRPAMNPYDQSTGGGGRWYPSLVTLADGSAIALCGHPRIYPASRDESGPPGPIQPPEDPRHNNNIPEIYRTGPPRWQKLAALGEDAINTFSVFYPRVHVLPGGHLLIVQPLYSSSPGSVDPSQRYGLQSLVYDAAAGHIVTSFPGPQSIGGQDYLISDTGAQTTTSVMLPLNPDDGYAARILLCSGHEALIADFTPGGPGPAWKPTPPRALAGLRWHANAVLLPTGQVFVCGGINPELYTNVQDGDPDYDARLGVRVPELYDPASGRWQALVDAPASVIRGYHSSALLMPDGKVWTGGSEINHKFGAASSEFRFEIFAPDYIDDFDRLALSAWPPLIRHAHDFEVRYEFPGSTSASVSQVAILRFGSVTHAFNYDQRYVVLAHRTLETGRLRVVSPPSSDIAIPGNYMLWLLDDVGRPCMRAGFVRVDDSAVRVPAGSEVTPVWRDPTHIDLFAAAADGTVQSTYQPGDGGWFEIKPATGGVAPGSPVTAVWSNPSHLDLFVAGANGAVLSTFWETAAAGWQDWFEIKPATGGVAPGSPVTAVWSNPSHLDLFVAGANGAVLSTFWETAAAGWQDWFAVRPDTGRVTPRARVNAK